MAGNQPLNTANNEGAHGHASPTAEDERWDTELTREDLDRERGWDPHDGDYQASEPPLGQIRGPTAQRTAAQTTLTVAETLAPTVHTSYSRYQLVA